MACNAWNFDEIGGAYKIATDLAIFCGQNGWDVHYVCGGKSNRCYEPQLEQGVQVWRYPRPSGSGQTKSPAHLWQHLKGCQNITRRILSTLDRNKTIVLNGHTHLQYCASLNVLRAFSRCYKVMSVHSPLTDEYKAEKNFHLSLGNKLITSVLSCIEAACYRQSRLIQCDSKFTSSLLAKEFKRETHGKLVVCPGYVDLEKFSVDSLTRMEARQKLSAKAWDSRDLCFFSLRRHVERMGVDTLIKALAWLRSQTALSVSRKFRLIIGGEGPLTGKLKDLASSLDLDQHIYFVGNIPEAEVALSYRASDCFILPTRSMECFGLVVLESFAAGTPVIATPVGAIPELLGPFKRQFLTEGVEPEALGKAMLNFLISEQDKGMEQELRQYASQFNRQVILKKLENLIGQTDGNNP
ncbi:MAG: hypothetical protein AUJ72_06260 [Candidatus Omnitrophica bacterium CG1_02_46_14]|nr:MAG: hypothetical protein AUJ72_06260 [Candidatus Omnitrophica bacterium CG1_02_46_14]